MKKLIFLLALAAVAAAVGFWRRKEAAELWGSATDTVTSWGESAATNAKEVEETARQAADSATKEAGKAAAQAADSATKEARKAAAQAADSATKEARKAAE